MSRQGAQSNESAGASQYERLRAALLELLQRSGGYEPTVDDLYVNTIVRDTRRCDEMDRFLDSGNANEHTYASITDAQAKRGKTIENAMHALAISRRDRLGAGESESGLMEQIRTVIMRWKEKNGKRGAS